MHLRISKYDPRNRDEGGRYVHDEWTSVSDIGRRFAGSTLKTADYLSIERAHIAFVQSVFSALRADSSFLPVAIEGNQRDWVKARNHALAAKLDPILTERLPSLNVALSLNELGDLARASLREFIWTKVSVPDRFVLSFGYDYYIYVSGSRVSNSYARMADRAGLFSERLRASPF